MLSHYSDTSSEMGLSSFQKVSILKPLELPQHSGSGHDHFSIQFKNCLIFSEILDTTTGEDSRDWLLYLHIHRICKQVSTHPSEVSAPSWFYHPLTVYIASLVDGLPLVAYCWCCRATSAEANKGILIPKIHWIIHFYLRHNDDIVIIWHMGKNLEKSHQDFNNFHPSTKLTEILHPENSWTTLWKFPVALITSTLFQKHTCYSYLHATSSYPKHTTKIRNHLQTTLCYIW